MAEKKNEQEKAATAVKEAKATAPFASVYTLKELSEASETVFETRPECVVAAFRMEGKTEATIEEAKKIVKKFMEKEVE